jgi:hypothetical protein
MRVKRPVSTPKGEKMRFDMKVLLVAAVSLVGVIANAGDSCWTLSQNSPNGGRGFASRVCKEGAPELGSTGRRFVFFDNDNRPALIAVVKKRGEANSCEISGNRRCHEITEYSSSSAVANTPVAGFATYRIVLDEAGCGRTTMTVNGTTFVATPDSRYGCSER